MPTNTLGVAARQDPRQVLNTLKKTVNFNDVGIGGALGNTFDNYLPQSAIIVGAYCEIVTPFNAVTTNVLLCGTNAGSLNNIFNAADINEAVAGFYESTRSYGRSLTSAGNVLPAVQYTQTGGVATAGQAVFLILFEGGWQT